MPEQVYDKNKEQKAKAQQKVVTQPKRSKKHKFPRERLAAILSMMTGFVAKQRAKHQVPLHPDPDRSLTRKEYYRLLRCCPSYARAKNKVLPKLAGLSYHFEKPDYSHQLFLSIYKQIFDNFKNFGEARYWLAKSMFEGIAWLKLVWGNRQINVNGQWMAFKAPVEFLLTNKENFEIQTKIVEDGIVREWNEGNIMKGAMEAMTDADMFDYIMVAHIPELRNEYYGEAIDSFAINVIESVQQLRSFALQHAEQRAEIHVAIKSHFANLLDSELQDQMDGKSDKSIARPQKIVEYFRKSLHDNRVLLIGEEDDVKPLDVSGRASDIYVRLLEYLDKQLESWVFTTLGGMDEEGGSRAKAGEGRQEQNDIQAWYQKLLVENPIQELVEKIFYAEDYAYDVNGKPLLDTNGNQIKLISNYDNFCKLGLNKFKQPKFKLGEVGKEEPTDYIPIAQLNMSVGAKFLASEYYERTGQTMPPGVDPNAVIDPKAMQQAAGGQMPMQNVGMRGFMQEEMLPETKYKIKRTVPILFDEEFESKHSREESGEFTKKGEGKTKQLETPEFTKGSEKQINWAENIREKFIKYAEKQEITEKELNDILQTKNEAKYWINNRNRFESIAPERLKTTLQKAEERAEYFADKVQKFTNEKFKIAGGKYEGFDSYGELLVALQQKAGELAKRYLQEKNLTKEQEAALTDEEKEKLREEIMTKAENEVYDNLINDRYTKKYVSGIEAELKSEKETKEKEWVKQVEKEKQRKKELKEDPETIYWGKRLKAEDKIESAKGKEKTELQKELNKLKKDWESEAEFTETLQPATKEENVLFKLLRKAKKLFNSVIEQKVQTKKTTESKNKKLNNNIALLLSQIQYLTGVIGGEKAKTELQSGKPEVARFYELYERELGDSVALFKLDYFEIELEVGNFNLQFEEAIEKLLKSQPMLAQTAEELRGYYFTGMEYGQPVIGSAYAKTYEQVTQLRDVLQDFLETGVREGREEEIQRILNTSRHYADNAFRTLTATAYSIGHQVQERPLVETGFIVAYELITMDDVSVRGNEFNWKPGMENHIAFEGIRLRADNPLWDRLTPPLGYSCRCLRRAITRIEAKSKNWLDKDKKFKEYYPPGWERGRVHPDFGRRFNI